MNLFECVPNICAGKNPEIINEIKNIFYKYKEVQLLNIDINSDIDRSVFTFVGNYENILQIAVEFVEKTYQLIDMRNYESSHPHLGACDVFPIIPLNQEDFSLGKKLAFEISQRIEEKLNLPIFNYEKSKDGLQLEKIRFKGYKTLKERLENQELIPDFGAKTFNEKFGAMVLGIRDFLIAYNVNLNASNLKLVNKIVKKLKEKINGDEKNPYLKAIGWELPTEEIYQISMNLTNFREKSLWLIYEQIREISAEFGVYVLGSEIIGLVPKKAMIDTGIFYLQKMGEYSALSEIDIIKMAVKSLGLSYQNKFEIENKVLEYALLKKQNSFRNQTLNTFLDDLSSKKHIPGGGSVAAMVLSNSFALISMVCSLTYVNKNYNKVWDEILEIGKIAQEMKEISLNHMDFDAKAFDDFMQAYKLPKNSEEEKQVFEKILEQKAEIALSVPLNVLKMSQKAALLSVQAYKIGNTFVISDAKVALELALSSAKSAFYNVEINLEFINNKEKVDNILNECKRLLQGIEEIYVDFIRG